MMMILLRSLLCNIFHMANILILDDTDMIPIKIRLYLINGYHQIPCRYSSALAQKCEPIYPHEMLQ